MGNIITNDSNSNLKEVLQALSEKADRVDIAVAFFSDSNLLREWDKNSKKINLIVSLRPTTNYYSLKDIQSCFNIDIKFLGEKFHSKFILFYKRKEIIGAVIGSSNFTSNGLINNIETNIFTKEKNILSELEEHFKDLFDKSNLLQPSDLDSYKHIYDNFVKGQKQTDIEVKEFINKATKNRTPVGGKARICKEASQYFGYWRTVDEVKELVKIISNKHFPNVPYYLVLDSFWHWVKAIWYKETGKTLNRNNQRNEIPKLFLKFIKTDTEEYAKENKKRSKQIFQVYLSLKNIDKLTKTKAKEVFENLHSSGMPIQRFEADELFINKNNIQKIKTSLKYLLYSNDEMDLRIHNLIMNPKYKLNYLGSSGVQEINGWTRPEIYPIRNDKADKALEILGYKLK